MCISYIINYFFEPIISNKFTKLIAVSSSQRRISPLATKKLFPRYRGQKVCILAVYKHTFGRITKDNLERVTNQIKGSTSSFRSRSQSGEVLISHQYLSQDWFATFLHVSVKGVQHLYDVKSASVCDFFS